jgi:uncharacterized protein with HEPN domain
MRANRRNTTSLKFYGIRDKLDILDSIYAIEIFVNGMTKNEFIRDLKTIYATRKAIEIIGEAAKKIPISIRDKYQDIPWREIAGMRDVLVHDYFNVDLNVLWKTVQEDIPELKSMFVKIIEDLNRG